MFYRTFLNFYWMKNFKVFQIQRYKPKTLLSSWSIIFLKCFLFYSKLSNLTFHFQAFFYKSHTFIFFFFFLLSLPLTFFVSKIFASNFSEFFIAIVQSFIFLLLLLLHVFVLNIFIGCAVVLRALTFQFIHVDSLIGGIFIKTVAFGLISCLPVFLLFVCCLSEGLFLGFYEIVALLFWQAATTYETLIA